MRLELKKIRAENAALAQQVQAGRESITQTEHCISTTVDEWKVGERKWHISKNEILNYIQYVIFLHSQRECSAARIYCNSM